MGTWHRIYHGRTMLVGIPCDSNLRQGSQGRSLYAEDVGCPSHFFFFLHSPEGRRNRSERNAKARRSIKMAQWAYKVVYIDYRGRISSEGLETLIANERRSTFARRYMNTLGRDGWELTGIQPLTANSAYSTFKRPAQEGDYADVGTSASSSESAPS